MVVYGERTERMQGEDTQDEGYITTTELAWRLRVNPMTINRWVKLGMPHHRWGQKTFRYRWPEVEQWLKERQKEKQADKRYLTTSELAAKLRVNHKAVRKYVGQGMPEIKAEGKWPRYDLSEVEKWLKDRWEEKGER